MLFFKKYISFVLLLCLCLHTTFNYTANFSLPVPDLKEQVNSTSDWREMGEKGMVVLNNFLIDSWHGASRNPRLIGAVLTTGGLFVLGHKYGRIATKHLGIDKCDAAINKKYLAAKKMINENAVSPIVSRMPSVPFFISPFVIIIKAIGGSIESYFLCSKPYIIGAVTSGSGFYLCGHPAAAGLMAALILAKGWISQDTAELKQGQAEIKADIANVKTEIQEQGKHIRQDIKDVAQQATRNKEELKKDIQKLSKHFDGVSADLKEEMQRQIVIATSKTEENITQLGTHIDDEFKAINKSVISEVAKIDEKIIDVLAKIDAIAEEAAREELIGLLSGLNEKSEDLKASFCKAIGELTTQGMLTQESLDSLQKELENLKKQQSVDSHRIAEINQRVSTILDKQAENAEILGEMKDSQMKIKINIAEQNNTLQKLVLSHGESFAKINSDIIDQQKMFSAHFIQLTDRFEETKQQSDDLVGKFFTQISGEVSAVKSDVSVLQNQVHRLEERNVALEETVGRLVASFDRYQEDRKKKDAEQKEKRKKDKRTLKDILSGQQVLHKTVDNLNKNLGAVATAVTGKLDAIGTAMTQQSLQIDDQVPTKKEKKSGALLEWFTGAGIV